MIKSPDKILFDYNTAAARLGIKTGTLYSWVSTHRIPCVRFGPRCVRFDPHALDEWVESHRVHEKNEKEA